MKARSLIAAAVLGIAATGAAEACTTADCTYAKTKYPIVIVHGLFGFSKTGPLDYFYQGPAALTAKGATVFAPAVSPVDSNDVRGEQLVTEVKKILAVTGAAKVNLVGHSQGAPTARYAAGVIPGNVASVTSIGGVNKGAPLADVVVYTDRYLPVLGSSVTYGIIDAVSSLMGITAEQVFEPQAQRALYAISSEGMQAFNQRFPNGVPTTACGEGAYSATVGGHTQYYYSWTGNAPGMTNLLDPLDPTIVQMSSAFLIQPLQQHDGEVGVCSAKFGKVLRTDYPWNHNDEVNQVTGLLGLFAPDPKQVLVAHANRLKNQGL